MTLLTQMELFPIKLEEAEKILEKSIWPTFTSEEDFLSYATQILPIDSVNTLSSLLSAHKNTVINTLKGKK